MNYVAESSYLFIELSADFPTFILRIALMNSCPASDVASTLSACFSPEIKVSIRVRKMRGQSLAILAATALMFFSSISGCKIRCKCDDEALVAYCEGAGATLKNTNCDFIPRTIIHCVCGSLATAATCVTTTSSSTSATTTQSTTTKAETTTPTTISTTFQTSTSTSISSTTFRSTTSVKTTIPTTSTIIPTTSTPISTTSTLKPTTSSATPTTTDYPTLPPPAPHVGDSHANIWGPILGVVAVAGLFGLLIWFAWRFRIWPFTAPPYDPNASGLPIVMSELDDSNVTDRRRVPSGRRGNPNPYSEDEYDERQARLAATAAGLAGVVKEVTDSDDDTPANGENAGEQESSVDANGGGEAAGSSGNGQGATGSDAATAAKTKRPSLVQRVGDQLAEWRRKYEEDKRREEAEKRRREEEEEMRREEEQKRQEEEKRRQAEEEEKRREEEQKREEKRREEEAKRSREEEQKRREEEQKRRKEEEKRRREEEQKRREEEQKRQEAEEKRQEEEERRRQEEEQKRREEEQKRREEEQKRQEEEEKRRQDEEEEMREAEQKRQEEEEKRRQEDIEAGQRRQAEIEQRRQEEIEAAKEATENSFEEERSTEDIVDETAGDTLNETQTTDISAQNNSSHHSSARSFYSTPDGGDRTSETPNSGPTSTSTPKYPNPDTPVSQASGNVRRQLAPELDIEASENESPDSSSDNIPLIAHPARNMLAYNAPPANVEAIRQAERDLYPVEFGEGGGDEGDGHDDTVVEVPEDVGGDDTVVELPEDGGGDDVAEVHEEGGENEDEVDDAPPPQDPADNAEVGGDARGRRGGGRRRGGQNQDRDAEIAAAYVENRPKRGPKPVDRYGHENNAKGNKKAKK